MATSTPWPMSILPKKAFTLPSGSTAIQESSSSGVSAGLPPTLCGTWESAVVTVPAVPQLTTSAPPALMKSRRVIGFMVISSDSRSGGALDRAQDRHVRAAAALDSRHGLPDFGVARLGISFEEGRRRHDPAGEA